MQTRAVLELLSRFGGPHGLTAAGRRRLASVARKNAPRIGDQLVEDIMTALAEQTVVVPGTKAAEAYGTEVIYERHRHRFEVNNAYRDALERSGMILSGQSPDGRLVEIVELPDHPWYVASQFHPEFRSRPDRPHPLFSGFVEAAIAEAERPVPVPVPVESA